MDIQEKSKEKQAYEEKINYINIFNQGIAGIENNQDLFLNKFYKETAEDFKHRFNRSRLSNYVNKAFEQIRGHLLQAKLEYDEAVFKANPALQQALENMNGQGQTIQEFVGQIIEKAIIEGFIPFIVDFDSFEGDQTKENADKAVPRFLTVDNANFINYKKNDETNILSNFIFEKTEEREAVLNPQEATLITTADKYIYVYYKKTAPKAVNEDIAPIEKVYLAQFKAMETEEEGDKPKYQFMGETEIQTASIPVEFVNFNKQDQKLMFNEVPPLYDLARLNGCLFRNEASQTEILRTSRLAIFAATGTKNAAPEGLAANQWVQAPEKDAKYYVVEVGGRAINAGKEDVEIAKKTLEDIQLDFLTGKGSNNFDKTATESIINQNNSLNKIEIYAKEIERFLNSIFNIAANWTNQKQDTIDFGFRLSLEDVSFINNDNKQLLLNSLKAGAISIPTYLELLKKYKVVGETFDIEKEILLIKEAEEQPDPSMLELATKTE